MRLGFSYHFRAPFVGAEALAAELSLSFVGSETRPPGLNSARFIAVEYRRESAQI